MSDNEKLETRATPLYPLLSSYCFNIYDLLQHELDRLNALDESELNPLDVQRRKTLNRYGIDKRYQYADVAFGVLENGYFLHAISSAAYIADYNREDGESHARKQLDTAMWEMNAFAVKDEAAGYGVEDSAVEEQKPTRYPLVDTWQQTLPRTVVTQGLGNEVNAPLVTIFNVGHILGWIHGVDNISDYYKDVTMAIGLLPNGFVVIGTYQSHDHESYSPSTGALAAYSDLEQQCLKYRLFVAKKAQYEINKLQDLPETVSDIDDDGPTGYVETD